MAWDFILVGFVWKLMWNFLTGVAAVQLSDGKDAMKDVSGEQKLIDWDKFRENILKWNEKKWAG